MLKKVLSRCHRAAGSSFLKQRSLPLALLSAQQSCSHFSSFPRYNQKVMNLTSFSKHAFASFPRHTKVTMPALSPTMEQGNVVKWHVQPGSKVEPGTQLCDIETDKATLAFEIQDAGYVAAILVPEGTKGVKVGNVVAIVVDNEKDVAAFANYKEGGETAQTTAQATATPEKAPEQPKVVAPQATQKLPHHSKVAMPALSPTMETGKITQWVKKEGDKVEAGDVIANVETDKATIDFVYQDEGYIAKLLVPEGKGTVKVGQLVAIIVDKKDDVKAFQDYSADSASQATAQSADHHQGSKQAEEQLVQTSKQQAEGRVAGERVPASPLARKTAQEQSIDLSQVQGSGPGGRVLKHNVDEFVQQGGAKAQAGTQAFIQPGAAKTEKEPAKEAKPHAKPVEPKFTEGQNPYVDTPLTTVREVIAKRLLQSKTTIPHYYLETEIVMDEAIKIRAVLNESAKTKLSFNDLFIKAAAQACIDVPEVNSQWHGEYIRRFKNADISVAVDTGSGLITPIVPAANTKGLNEISLTAKELIEKAKKNALKPHEFMGGTFSISNLGMFGITNFAAVINPPQSAILAVGKTDQKVVMKDGTPKTVNVMNVTLSCDHRVVDGAVGARWLERFKSYLEKPYTMLL